MCGVREFPGRDKATPEGMFDRTRKRPLQGVWHRLTSGDYAEKLQKRFALFQKEISEINSD